MIISGEYDNSTLKDLGAYTQIAANSTPAGAAEIISKSLISLLTDESLLTHYRDQAIRKGRSFTWTSVAKTIKNRFVSLREQLLEKEFTLPNPPSFFQYHYDTIQGKTSPAALERPSFFREDVDMAIAKELIHKYSRNQVSVVLKHICKDVEMVERMLTYLTTERTEHE